MASPLLKTVKKSDRIIWTVPWFLGGQNFWELQEFYRYRSVVVECNWNERNNTSKAVYIWLSALPMLFLLPQVLKSTVKILTLLSLLSTTTFILKSICKCLNPKLVPYNKDALDALVKAWQKIKVRPLNWPHYFACTRSFKSNIMNIKRIINWRIIIRWSLQAIWFWDFMARWYSRKNSL